MGLGQVVALDALLGCVGIRWRACLECRVKGSRCGAWGLKVSIFSLKMDAQVEQA